MIESKFKGRNIVEKPACPFCTRPLERPAEARSSTMPMGSCTCGAVYVCDVTGHNLGSALVDALLGACSGDSDSAWNLVPDLDYLERQIRNYDLETHQIIHGGVYQGRRIAGVLLFIRLTTPGEGSKPAENTAIQAQESGPQSTAARARPRPLSKQEVATLVSSYDLEPLLASAELDKRIIRSIKRLLYSPDELLRRRAAEALGRVSAVIFPADPAAVSRLLQELFSSLTDTAASAWGAIDAIGEIIRFQSDAFDSYIPRLAQLSRDRSLIEDVLRALVTIGSARPGALHMMPPHLIRLLEDQNRRIQAYAVILVGYLRVAEAKKNLQELRDSPEEIPVYMDGTQRKKTIGCLAAEALSRL